MSLKKIEGQTDLFDLLKEVADTPISEITDEQVLSGKASILKTQIRELKKKRERGKNIEEVENEIQKKEKELAETKKKIEMFNHQPKNFNKRLFISNVREVAKQKKVKFGDIETRSGTSVGYTSRLDKPGNPNDPSVEFVATAAKMLGEKVDDLMYKDYRQPPPRLTENEQYALKFVNKLIEDTSGGKLIWDRETAESLQNRLQYDEIGQAYADHPLLEIKSVQVGIDENTGYPEYNEYIYYNSSFYEEGSTLVNGAGYVAELSDIDAKIYVMNILHSDENDGFDVKLEDQREVYIVDREGCEPLCNTEFICEEVRQKVFELYNMLENSFSKISLSSKARRLINEYVDGV